MTITVDRHLDADSLHEQMRADVRLGLTSTPKVLPPTYFYDEAGSDLFDEITRLEEYYPTRREREILDAHADEIARGAGSPPFDSPFDTPFDTLVEIGSGTSEKTRILLDALSRTGSLRRFVPFDVDDVTLLRAGDAVSAEYPGVDVHAVVGDFTRHVSELPRGGSRLVAFLGSTIGNLEPGPRATFLHDLAATFGPHDALLLGTDLVKDERRLVAAYDDSAGVTAAFNRNVLYVLDRELKADFDPEAFAHHAVWNADAERMEMWLRSERDQRVHVGALDLDVSFAAGEEMRTEVSGKFREQGVRDELAAAGLRVVGWWTDAAGDYGLSLSVRA
jgi:L-histidine N-alpha-methyltransferase